MSNESEFEKWLNTGIKIFSSRFAAHDYEHGALQARDKLIELAEANAGSVDFSVFVYKNKDGKQICESGERKEPTITIAKLKEIAGIK